MEHPVLAIDHGEARIGLAATDALGIAAHPVETITVEHTNPLQRIVELVKERGVRRLVIGLPLRLDGSEGRSAARVRSFAGQLCEALPGIPIDFADERLSTAAAAEKLHGAGKSARQQKSLIDQAAALEILNDWLREQGDWF